MTAPRQPDEPTITFTREQLWSRDVAAARLLVRELERIGALKHKVNVNRAPEPTPADPASKPKE